LIYNEVRLETIDRMTQKSKWRGRWWVYATNLSTRCKWTCIHFIQEVVSILSQMFQWTCSSALSLIKATQAQCFVQYSIASLKHSC